MSNRISVIILNYNGMKYINNCLISLHNQTHKDYEILVVDNNSSDYSAEFIAQNFPTVKLISAKENLGFGGGNNLGAQHATGQYLVFLNQDTTATPDCIAALVFPFENDPQIGMTTSKILIMATPDRINTCGNDVHFTGIGYLRGWQAASNTYNQMEEVCSVSGASFAISKTLFDDLGGFDEAFFPAYVEDTDLSWRVRLRGNKCIYAPDSIIYHDYKSGFGPDKFFRIERNRYQMLIKTYHWRTLILLMPALLLSEFVSWGYACLYGKTYIYKKLNAYSWLVSHRADVLTRRQQVQRKRVVADRTLLRHCAYRLAFDQAVGGLLGQLAGGIFNFFFFCLYQLYLLLIWW